MIDPDGDEASAKMAMGRGGPGVLAVSGPLIEREAVVALVIEACNECDSGCGSCFATADAIRALPAFGPSTWKSVAELTRVISDFYEDSKTFVTLGDIAELAMSRAFPVQSALAPAGAEAGEADRVEAASVALETALNKWDADQIHDAEGYSISWVQVAALIEDWRKARASRSKGGA